MYVVRKWPLRGEKSSCVLEHQTNKSVVTVQRAFGAKCAQHPPTDRTTRAWFKQFTETGCLVCADRLGEEIVSRPQAQLSRVRKCSWTSCPSKIVPKCRPAITTPRYVKPQYIAHIIYIAAET